MPTFCVSESTAPSGCKHGRAARILAVPFNHNDHYHPLLLRQVPSGACKALDVGCGTGKFARRLAAGGLDVDGVDPSPVVEVARSLGSPGTATITYRQEDITEAALPATHYDFVSCLASLHHMPFETVLTLRDALAPGGVLAVLGLATPRSAADWANWAVLGPPVNLAARLTVAVGERLNGGADQVPMPPIRAESMSMTEVRRLSREFLPGSTVRPLLFWRYLLLYRA